VVTGGGCLWLRVEFTGWWSFDRIGWNVTRAADLWLDARNGNDQRASQVSGPPMPLAFTRG